MGSLPLLPTRALGHGFLLSREKIGGLGVAERTRVRMFVDFWNFQIGWNQIYQHSETGGIVPIPWKDVLPSLLIAEAAKGQAAKFSGAHVYASVDPNNPKERGLRSWLHHGLKSFPGYSVVVKERKARKPIRCQDENCKTPITICQSAERNSRVPWKRGSMRRLSRTCYRSHLMTTMILES